MNLILALLWLLGGIAVLAYDASVPGARPGAWGGRFSIGWLMLLMSLYNVVRWWVLRASRASRRPAPVPPYRRNRPPERDEPPDPNFDFTDSGPPPPGG
jgi:hypothetical protein